MQMYPAPIRSTAHGISAATGKVGSISVVVWLNYLGNRNKFWITWPFALAGAVCCWVFVADNTGLDLAEQVSPELHSCDTYVPCIFVALCNVVVIARCAAGRRLEVHFCLQVVPQLGRAVTQSVHA